MVKEKTHDFCRFELKEIRKETKFRKKITGLSKYYETDGKTYEIDSCCRWSGKVQLIQEVSVNSSQH